MPTTRHTHAFTLPELLMIIAILGILAAVLLPNLLNARRPAYDSAALVCAHSLWQHATAAHLDTPDQPYPTADTLRTQAPPCIATPQLTITTITTQPDTFTYTIAHPGGRTLVTANERGIHVDPRP